MYIEKQKAPYAGAGARKFVKGGWQFAAHFICLYRKYMQEPDGGSNFKKQKD